MKTSSVMIVEENAELRGSLRTAFEEHGYTAWTFPNPDIALSIFRSFQPTVIVLDLDMAGSNALRLIDDCRSQCPLSSMIVESQTADNQRMQEAIAHGANAFLVKPYAIGPLFEMLRQPVEPGTPAVIPFHRAA